MVGHKIRRALEESLDPLGENSKRMVIRHITHNGISLDEKDCSSVQDIHRELQSLLGEGATVITSRMNRKLAAIQP